MLINTESPKNALPKGMLKTDVKRPGWDSKDRTVSELGNYGSFEMYYVTGRGWVILTQQIGGRRHGPYGNRSYGIQVSNKAVVRVGGGPHVTELVTVYLRKSRVKALQEFIDLYNSGAVKAGTISDRISSRRAEGQLRRARGERSWYWTN